MKKKNLFGILALVSMFFTTSCSQDDLSNESLTNDFVNATFTLGTDDVLGSRAIGDGTTVDKVACAVYDAQGNELSELSQKVSFDGTTEDGKRKATFNTRLAKGHEYRVAFFAYNEAANAYNVDDLKKITVNSGQLSNVEGRDAFTAYYVVEAGKTMNIINETVILKRPFAQLNLGINNDELEDARKAGIIVDETKIIVSNVHNVFSAYDDAVVDGNVAAEMEFGLNDIPKEKLVINNQEYNYLAMNYLLVGDKGSEKSLTDVKFIYKTTTGVMNEPVTIFNSIPVQRNYRTNILGRLLTTPAEFTLVIDNSFEGTKAVLEPVEVNTWDEFTVAVGSIDPNYQYIRLCSDITYNDHYTLSKDVTIDLNNYSLGVGPKKLFNNKSNSTIQNGIINGLFYHISGDATYSNIKFSGDVQLTTSTEAQFQIKGGNVLVKDCIFNNTSYTGTKPRSVSVEGRSTGSVKFEGCYFYSTKSERVYVNQIKETANVEFSNCTFSIAPIFAMTGGGLYSNLTLVGSKSSMGISFEMYDRTKDQGLTEDETAIIKSIFNNNIISSAKLYYNGATDTMKK